MMPQPLILLHEESLRITHPVFDITPEGTRVIYIWDDIYVRHTGYSLKRLIFIYETLCELEVDILRGDTQKILQQINPSIVYIPHTNNPLLLQQIDSIRERVSIEMVTDDTFVNLKKNIKFNRFFQYWRMAEKKAFLIHGGLNAERN
jgi:hypothetical protein